jgi:hypothetical protein
MVANLERPLAVQHRPRRRRAGFTILELSITSLLLVIVLGALAWAMEGMRGLVISGTERSSLQTEGQVALREIMIELQRSGRLTLDGLQFPVVFEGGDPGPDFPAHVHAPAVDHAVAGDPDFGLDRELIFRLPRDADGDRRPDIDENGGVIWAAEEFSFVAVTRADGLNYLERRTDGANPEIVARFVERVVFDDAPSSGYQIPLGSIRIRLFLRKLDGTGTLRRYFTEAIVAMRNG